MTQQPLFLNNFPARSYSFVGRESRLQKIHEIFTSDANILLVNGVGGIGKTALITEYCHQNISQFDHYIWLSGKNGMLENLAADPNIKSNLGIDKDVDNIAQLAHRIINKLNQLDGKNLLVLDDLDEDFHQFRKIFPLAENWKVLGTSRYEFSDYKSITIGALSGQEVLDLFYKHYTLQQNDELVIKIFQPLSFHALTVELFAKTAQFHKLPLKDLSERIASLGFNFTENININIEHSSTTIANIGKYYDKIFSPDNISQTEVEVLRNLMVLPSSYVQINDLFRIFAITTDKNEDVFSFTINNLVQKGWIENFLTSYRLNKIIKKYIEFKYPAQFDYYEAIIKRVADFLSVDTVKSSPVAAFKWMEFGQELTNYFKITNDQLATLYNNLALRYRDKGNFEEARLLLKQVLAFDIKKYGKENQIVMLSQANLGNVYSDLGNYEKAAELLKQALKSAQKVYPKNHPKIASKMSNLGLVCRDLGNLPDATRYLYEALNADIKNFGEDDSTVAVRQSNLSLVYKDIGEYAKARDLLEASIATTIKHDGEMHPRVALRYSNLALVYKAMGEYRKAVDLLEKALQSDLKNFGETHPKVAVRLMNISIIYLEINELKQAYKAITQSYSIALATLGADHPDTLIIKGMYDNITGG